MDDIFFKIILPAILAAIALAILLFYRQELIKNRKNIDNLLAYIGSINIQIRQIEAFFSDIKKIPENKNDLKYIFKILTGRILSIVNADWVILRIVDIKNLQTLSERTQARGKAPLPAININNKNLIKNDLHSGLTAIKSSQENFDIKVFCVLPKNRLTGNQKIIIGKAVDDLAMLYLIFSSGYYNRR